MRPSQVTTWEKIQSNTHTGVGVCGRVSVMSPQSHDSLFEGLWKGCKTGDRSHNVCAETGEGVPGRMSCRRSKSNRWCSEC